MRAGQVSSVRNLMDSIPPPRPAKKPLPAAAPVGEAEGDSAEPAERRRKPAGAATTGTSPTSSSPSTASELRGRAAS